MNRYDSLTSLVWFLVGTGIVIYTSLTLKIGTIKQPGTGFLPLLCGMCIAGLGLIVFFKSKGIRKKSSAESFWKKKPLFQILITIGILLGYAIFLERLGFILATFILMLLIITQVARTSWLIGFLESLIATGCCYLLFGYLLKIQLPKGWLGF